MLELPTDLMPGGGDRFTDRIAGPGSEALRSSDAWAHGPFSFYLENPI
jgi:hypothetical protein